MDRAVFSLPFGEVHALTAGDPRARPLVYLHGFPDHPPTAAAFLAPFATSHRVVAPWLRGYAPSPRVGPYDIETLAADAVALIDRVGGPVDLVGHDWGAVITYAVCQLAPARVRRAVTLAVPHPGTFMRALAYSAQWRKSWYMALFQLPGAERIVRARDLALIDYLWRTWSPGFTLPADQRADLHACLAASLPAPIDYYRAILRPLTTLVDRVRKSQARITVPLLQLHGADDGCMVPPTDRDRRWFAAERVLEIVPNVGHFLHLEEPAAIGERIRLFLK